MTEQYTPAEIEEMLVWAREAITSPYGCYNGYEMALDFLIEHDGEDNKDKWIKQLQEVRESRDWQSDG